MPTLPGIVRRRRGKRGQALYVAPLVRGFSLTSKNASRYLCRLRSKVMCPSVASLQAMETDAKASFREAKEAPASRSCWRNATKSPGRMCSGENMSAGFLSLKYTYTWKRANGAS
jgi:hypothetical protein